MYLFFAHSASYLFLAYSKFIAWGNIVYTPGHSCYLMTSFILIDAKLLDTVSRVFNFKLFLFLNFC